MKLRFEKPESQWLEQAISRLVYVTRHAGAADDRRTAKKMQYKFGGSPHYVWLTRKERQLIAALASYRASTLATQPTDELAVVHRILEVLNAAN